MLKGVISAWELQSMLHVFIFGMFDMLTNHELGCLRHC